MSDGAPERPIAPVTDLERFASMAAHELRSPLQVMTGFATLLGRVYGPQLDEQGGAMVRWILTAGARQEALISAIVAYVRVAGPVDPVGPVDLDAVMLAVVAALDTAVEGTGVEGTGAAVTWEPLPTVIGDQTRLTQVLQNLVANAITFVAEGTVPAVHVSAAAIDGEVRVSVADNGIGIDPDDTDEIFKPFARLHPQERYDGTGMGLSICRRIIEAAGGRIWIDAVPAGGSIFHFTVLQAADEGSKR